MPIKDIHETPFSEETILKLDIFMDYAEAWLPVFVHSRTHRKIAIFDFFAGPGYDSNRVPGSPIRLLSTIKKYETAIRANNKQILIFLNEFDKAKHPKLIQSVNSYLEDNSMLKGNISVKIENRDFEEVFFASNQALNSPIPCLIYCDQNGVKQITERTLSKLEELERTDFMFFVASSFFSRFGNEDSFRAYFPDLDIEELQKVAHGEKHTFLLDYYKSKLPKNSDLQLYPFSIKKGGNIYGIIFGAKHPLAVQKFLDIAWEKNPENGQANYDIHQDAQKKQGDFFKQQFTRFDQFKNKLWHFVVSKQRCTNCDIFDFVLKDGFSRKKTEEILRSWRENGKIQYKGRAGLSYDACYKKSTKRNVEFKVLN